MRKPNPPAPHNQDTLGRERPHRTYVVLGYRQPRRAGDPVTVVGTVMAPSRAAAAPLARSLVRERGRALSPPITDAWAVRWWVASACRRGWLLEALANDGAKLRGVG